MSMRSTIYKFRNSIRGFFRRLGYVKSNKMSLRSWLFTLFSLLGFLISLGGYHWADTVSQQFPTLPSGASEVTPNSLPPISETRQDVDVILAIDFSGSMDGDNGSDPNGLRFRAAEIMASSLAADIYPRQTRMGYLQFGSNIIRAEELKLIDSNEARLELVKSIYDFSNKPNEEKTNIGGALEEADQIFYENGHTANADDLEPAIEKNVPALVLLTDGRPTTGYMNQEKIGKLVDNLVQKNTLIFIVVLRDPNKYEDAVNNDFEEWRQFWSDVSEKYPLNVEYDDVQDDTQLEYIYNKIRSRLVKEGTEASDITVYDPLDPNAEINMPPNLLQVHLIVSKPLDTESIQLITPAGNNFADQLQSNDPLSNNILDGNFFVRFKVTRPMAGPWQLETNVTEPLYYLLNIESIYSPRLLWPIGNPYLYKSQKSQVPFVIADEKGNVVNKLFDLTASILRVEKNSQGVYEEKRYPLSEIHIDTVSGQTQYLIDILPSDFANESMVTIQVDGSANDGSLANSVIISLPVIDAPSGLNDQIDAVISEPCDVSKRVLWPPSLLCKNTLELSVQIDRGDLLKNGTVNGKLYSPLLTGPVDMDLEHPNTLKAVLGPIQSTGSYEIVMDVGGTLEQSEQNEHNFQWYQRINKTLNITIPGWVDVMKTRFSYATVLFLICTLWKIVIVPVLLLFFSLFRFAPDGSYSKDLTSWSSVFRRAMERRKLFTLTVGYRRNNDISNSPQDNAPSIRNKFLKLIYQYFYNAPRSHIFWIPLIGLYGEDAQGMWTEADIISSNISTGKSQIYIKK